ncbi:hypothetical protein LTR36_004425 [Oleoguttula mirabilis]|uniref:RGS domain-containing protein n=1 Tax=Oleoguttula mirabilis TaxID=1507867 RepID=A0AAV9JHA2_9PEZI|nr:hypothetical protein LTR36_004425 [Oleoguttula mirabilis]
MASARLYRDYINDESAAPRRTPSFRPASTTSSSPRRATSRIDSPRALHSDIKPDGQHKRTSSPREQGFGIGTAQTTDEYEDEDEDTDSFRGSRTSIAQTTEDNSTTPTTPYGDDTSEPVLHEAQFDLHSMGSATPAPFFRADSNKLRGVAPSVMSMATSSPGAGEAQVSGRPSASGRLPEFFSLVTFHIVLQNPTIAHQLTKFAQSRLCGENLEFLARVTKYYALLGEVSKSIYEIHRDFISSNAPNQVNLPQHVLSRTNNEMKASLASTLPALESIFGDAQNDIEQLVYNDVYPHFVRNQMSVSAARALGGDRAKYGGLGDCFVLTDPAKADNPIVYASDGFVKVTGYQRSEIIPRNCRFLQCRDTDRSAVRRLKATIDKRQDSVELLLNEKKNGEPFWNLLYTTPLYDGFGNLAFFLGGQINCSTTIHNASDMLNILGQSKESDNETAPDAAPQLLVKPPRSRGILNAFRSNSRTTLQPRPPGMENSLLDRIEDMPLKNQMDTFHLAYSNYLIINASSLIIAFVSAGLLELLFPIKAKTSYHAQAVGADIFKFLGNHGSGSVSWDYKSAVKGAMKTGKPISLELKLCARPYMGFEMFVLHWTPLKDEVGKVGWIVLTLGNERRA